MKACNFSLSFLVFLITHIHNGTCNLGIQFITSLGQQRKSITSQMSLKSTASKQCPRVHVAKCGPVVSMTQKLNFSHFPDSSAETSGREAWHGTHAVKREAFVKSESNRSHGVILEPWILSCLRISALE